MVARGMVRACRSICFTCVRSSVTPAIWLNSPPAIVVGTLICRTAGGLSGGSSPPRTRMPSMPSMVETSLARQSCTALAPSVIEPPPTVTMRSALASRAWLAAAITAARGVCAGILSKMPTQRAPIGVADGLDLAGLAVERPAHHQEGAFGAEPVELLDDGFRGMASEHDLVHGAEYDTALVHAVLPGTLLLGPS